MIIDSVSMYYPDHRSKLLFIITFADMLDYCLEGVRVAQWHGSSLKSWSSHPGCSVMKMSA